MTIGALYLDLMVPDGQSLKEKRSVLKSVKDQLRRKFNIAIAEVEEQDRWQRAGLGVAAVGSDKRYVNGLLSQVVEWVRASRLVELIDYQLEMY